MISKAIVTRFCILFIIGILSISSCRKKEPVSPVEPEESGQSGIDSREAMVENDLALADVNEIVSGNKKMSGRGTEVSSICGLFLDSVQANTGVIKLIYDGTTCNNRNRTGSIRLTLQNYASGKRWKDVGAVLQVEYLNYKVTRASDQKSIMLNGTQLLTNASGGNWLKLLLQTQSNLVTTITGTNLQVTWQDNSNATYNIHRKITYSFSNNILTTTAEGIGTSGGLNNLENFGTTRDGHSFTSQVTTPIVWNTTCGGGAPVQGAATVKVANKDFELKFLYGVDAAGNSVPVSNNQCPFGWKLEWSANSDTPKSKVIRYL